jgi:nitrate reductase delta subunit
MRLYKLLSVLLEYSTQELCEHFAEIEQVIPTLDQASDEDKQALRNFTAWARSLPLTEWQALYVKTFDLTPDNALYLTHHLFEEQDRGRGPTLVRLSEYFRTQGYEVGNGELPDYLPLLLEYVSTLPDASKAQRFLQQSAHVAAIVAQNLESIESPYAPLLRIVERHGKLSELAA